MANTPTPFQPTILLDPNTLITDAEQNFIDESPPNLFPENQDSNWGYKRKIFSDVMQASIDQLDTIYNERYIETASQFLDEWEEQMHVPVAPTNFTEAERRAIIKGRLRRGAWTHERIEALIESFISVTYGPAILITPEGIELTAAGIPFYAESGTVKSFYRVYYDLANYSYTVWIRNDIAPTMRIAELTRELAHFTPAPITFTVNTAPANVLDYQRTILSDGPSFYYPLATSSGTGNPWQSIAGIPSVLTVVGSPTNVSALIQNGGGVVGDTQARDFNGTTDYVVAPDNNAFAFGAGGYSLEAWVSIDAFPATNDRGDVLSLGGDIYNGKGRIGTWNHGGITKWSFGCIYQSDPIVIDGENIIESPLPALSTTYHIVGTWTGQRARFYVNGVKVTDQEFNVTNPKTFYPIGVGIGRYWHYAGNFFNGKIDEPAVYGYPLSDEQVLKHYRTGINLP